METPHVVAFPAEDLLSHTPRNAWESRSLHSYRTKPKTTSISGFGINPGRRLRFALGQAVFSAGQVRMETPHVLVFPAEDLLSHTPNNAWESRSLHSYRANPEIDMSSGFEDKSRQ